MQKALLIALIALSGAKCQDQRTRYFGSRATPAALTISCRVEEATRSVTVTIANHTARKCYFQRSGPVTDYEVIITSMTGKRLTDIKPDPSRQSSGRELRPITVSTAMIALGPKEEYTSSFPLSYHAALPKGGGKFRIQVGQGLFFMHDDPFELDPNEIIWCKPIDVTLPPM